MGEDFLGRAREHCSALSQGIAIRSNNNRWPFVFLAPARIGRVALKFWRVDARHPSRPRRRVARALRIHFDVTQSGDMAGNIKAAATLSLSWEDAWAGGSS
jgi:hypothetical protein